jgi:hypothetical protein
METILGSEVLSLVFSTGLACQGLLQHGPMYSSFPIKHMFIQITSLTFNAVVRLQLFFLEESFFFCCVNINSAFFGTSGFG